MSHPLKFVISGPVGAGKTTFISTLSDTPVVSTDELASEDIGKAGTTVAMDFGTLVIDGIPIYLFGTPGQDRFDYMWEVLSQGALGLLLLIAGDRPSDFMKARHILDVITTRSAVPFIIGVTRQDLPRVWAPEDVADFFQVPPEFVVGLDGRDRPQCFGVLLQLLEIVAGRMAAPPAIV
jgi:signal recognition particle receptor subunit beta